MIDETPAVSCQTCLDNGYYIQFYDRGPGDNPGNSMVACPDCEEGEEFAAQINEVDWKMTVTEGKKQ